MTKPNENKPQLDDQFRWAVAQDSRVLNGEYQLRKAFENSKMTQDSRDNTLNGERQLRKAFESPAAQVPVKVKRLHPDAAVPTYAHDGDSGFDLAAVRQVVIKPHTTEIIPTGIAVGLPEGFEIQARPRSGKSSKTKLRIANSPGTVDQPYIGEIGVIVDNTGDEEARVEQGEKIAQGVLARVPRASFYEVDELDETSRGAGGYGSTDTNDGASYATDCIQAAYERGGRQ